MFILASQEQNNPTDNNTLASFKLPYLEHDVSEAEQEWIAGLRAVYT